MAALGDGTGLPWGSRVWPHLRNTSGERVGVRPGLGPGRGKMEGTGQQWLCGLKARVRMGWGAGLRPGRERALKQGSLKATRRLGSRTELVAHRPFASRPRRPFSPSSPRTANSPEGAGRGRGALLAAAASQPPTRRGGLSATDNRKRLSRRLTQSRRFDARPRP